MLDVSKTILEKYQVRKSREQKDEFIYYLKSQIGEDQVKIETSGLLKSRNLIVGDVDQASLIFTAHYDTPAQLPFPNFIAPKSFMANMVYFFLVLFFFVIVRVLFKLVVRFIGIEGFYHNFFDLIFTLLLVYLMFAGKANQHNANDNTSGVITLLETYFRLSEEQRKRVAFVFFDHEELGLVGSRQFAKLHKKSLKEKPLMNFDCVGVGDKLMIIISRYLNDEVYRSIENSYHSKGDKEMNFTKNKSSFYASDQMNFKHGIGVAAFRSSRWCKYYLSDVHTSKDTILEKENIELLAEGTVRWIETYCKENVD